MRGLFFIKVKNKWDFSNYYTTFVVNSAIKRGVMEDVDQIYSLGVFGKCEPIQQTHDEQLAIIYEQQLKSVGAATECS